jgi:hypothetical protein
MPKRLDPGAKQGIMTKTHRQTLDGKKHPSFATQSRVKRTWLADKPMSLNDPQVTSARQGFRLHLIIRGLEHGDVVHFFHKGLFCIARARARMRAVLCTAFEGIKSLIIGETANQAQSPTRC